VISRIAINTTLRIGIPVGLEVFSEKKSYADHKRYTLSEFQALIAPSNEAGTSLTEKNLTNSNEWHAFLTRNVKLELIELNEKVISMMFFGIVIGSFMSSNVLKASLVGALPVTLSILLPSEGESGELKEIRRDSYSREILSNPINTCLIAPVLEEACFRGFLLGYVLSSFPASISIGASAVIFGAMHLMNGPGSERQSLNAAILGINLGMLYTSMGLSGPIAAHIINNTLVQNKIIQVIKEELHREPELP